MISLYGCGTFEEFLKYTGNSFRGMVHPEDYHKIQNQIQAQTMFGEKRHDYVRYRILTKQGQERYIEDFGHLLHGKNGKSFFYVFIVDVDQNEYLNRNRNSYAEAEILSGNQDTDPLTGLFNMPFFYNSVMQLLSTPEGRRKDISIVHFDIPNFKLYNERNGFRLGDELLCDLARVIKEEFKDGIVARFSDDHFVVCAATDREAVVASVEAVHRKMLRYEEAAKRVRIKAGDPIVPASINFSRLDFELCDIFDTVEKVREKYQVPRNMLDLEITESALNDNLGHIRQECDKMRALGYQVWIDDFGSGYSSLNTIAEYSFDVLKLDMVFLRNFNHNPKTATLMSYIMKAARGMGIQPLCEGVETAEHYEFLKEAGCEKAQGYYFGKPMPLEETKAFTLAKGMTWEK